MLIGINAIITTMAVQVAAATERRDAAAAAADAAAGAIEAAQRELAGAEAGDGRDKSNRSVQERLSDAQTAQVGPPSGLTPAFPTRRARAVCLLWPSMLSCRVFSGGQMRVNFREHSPMHSHEEAIKYPAKQ